MTTVTSYSNEAADSEKDSRPDPRDALIGTDVSDAAIADATIARLSAELAAACEALEFSKKMFAHGNEHGFSDTEMAMINERLDAVLAELSKTKET